MFYIWVSNVSRGCRIARVPTFQGYGVNKVVGQLRKIFLANGGDLMVNLMVSNT